jgi:hypothetical protein
MVQIHSQIALTWSGAASGLFPKYGSAVDGWSVIQMRNRIYEMKR